MPLERVGIGPLGSAHVPLRCRHTDGSGVTRRWAATVLYGSKKVTCSDLVCANGVVNNLVNQLSSLYLDYLGGCALVNTESYFAQREQPMQTLMWRSHVLEVILYLALTCRLAFAAGLYEVEGVVKWTGKCWALNNDQRLKFPYTGLLSLQANSDTLRPHRSLLCRGCGPRRSKTHPDERWQRAALLLAARRW